MKTKRAFSLGFAALLALVAVIGFTACSDDSGDSGGSSSGSYTESDFYGTYTYTVNGISAVSFTFTSSSWSFSGFSGTWEYEDGHIYCYYGSSLTYDFTVISSSRLSLDLTGYGTITLTKQ